MSRVLAIVFVLTVFTGQNICMAQKHYDVLSFRNYNQSLTLSIAGKHHSNFLYLPNGDLDKKHSAKDLDLYLFQSQEYDDLLHLYFFPERIYSSKKLRFFQPDSKSQYYSPFVFVGSDPINYIDRDGNIGKPLVLYAENHLYMQKMDESIRDLQTEFKDAHYLPLSKFVNGEVGDLPEWNGNVYIDSHSSTDRGKEITLEQAEEAEELSVKPEVAMASFNDSQDVYETTIDARRLGNRLREFADERGVRVNNVFAGGCEGSAAAERIGQGYIEAGPRNVGSKLRTVGLKENRKALIVGKKLAAEENIYGVDRTRFYVIGKVRGYTPIDRLKRVEGKRVVESNLMAQNKDGTHEYLPYVEGDEVQEMANGRVPNSLQKYFKEFTFEY